MASNYSVLLYGLGSKRQLLEMFRQNYLAGEYDHVTINGYFPGLTVKQIFSCIIGKQVKWNFNTSSKLKIDITDRHN